MRDEGLEAPRNLLSKIIYFVTKKRFGKVLLPVKIHAYSPATLLGFGVMTHIHTRPAHLDPALSLLAQARVAALVGCPF